MQRIWKMAFFCDLRTYNLNYGYFTVVVKKTQQRGQKWTKMAFDFTFSEYDKVLDYHKQRLVNNE
jgi:hypothetical protein